jgi:hypothetical protein
LLAVVVCVAIATLSAAREPAAKEHFTTKQRFRSGFAAVGKIKC